MAGVVWNCRGTFEQPLEPRAAEISLHHCPRTGLHRPARRTSRDRLDPGKSQVRQPCFRNRRPDRYVDTALRRGMARVPRQPHLQPPRAAAS